MMYDVLMQGFPGRTDRGFLGWSTIVLLHTEDGPVLFDTGGPGDRPGLLAALAARDLRPGDIRAIVLSHLHFDHVANVECFPEAQLIMHQKELGHFLDHGAGDPAVPYLLVKGMLAERSVQLMHGEIEVFRGIHLMLTPGHTHGHCALILRLEGAVHVLAQDAAKSRIELNSRLPAGAVDDAAAQESIARIAAMADVVVPGHDTTLFRTEQGFVPRETLRTDVTLPGFDRTYRMEV